MESKNKFQLKYCILTNILEKYLDEYLKKSYYQWNNVFKGKILHARKILPILKDGDFDIIHIILSKADINLIEIIKKIIGAKSKTKIILSIDLSIVQLFKKFNSSIYLKEKVKKSDLVICSNYSLQKDLEKIFDRKVYYIPFPVNIELSEKIKKHINKKQISVIWNRDDKNIILQYLTIKNEFSNIKLIGYVKDKKLCNYYKKDETIFLTTSYKIFLESVNKSNIIFIPHNILDHHIINDLASLKIPTISSNKNELLSLIYPSTTINIKNKKKLKETINLLLYNNKFYHKVVKFAKYKLNQFNFVNSKIKLLKRLYDITVDLRFRPNTIWERLNLINTNKPDILTKPKLLSSATILGCNTFHDGGTALLQNGILTNSIEAEKDSKKRHSNFDKLENKILSLKEKMIVPDIICLIGNFTNYRRYYGLDDSVIKINIRKIHNKEYKIFQSSHERAHIFGVYGMSPYPQGTPCYVLIWEGAIGKFIKIDKNCNFINLGTPFHNVGIYYTMPYFISGASNTYYDFSNAGKTMALASFAKKENLWQDEITYLLNLPEIYEFREKYKKPIFKGYEKFPFYNLGVNSQIFKEFVFNFQNTIFNKFYKFAKENMKEKLPLLITGGCGLNCDWNTKWNNSGLFTDVFVPPCPNDSGIALGIATDAQYYFTGNTKIKWNVYSGEDFIVDDVSFNNFIIYDLNYNQIVNFLLKDKVIAWVQGKYEIGPRALCHRSLIAAPFKKEIHNKLNKIKQRESFRPIAPVCLEEDVSEYFNEKKSSPFMLYFQNVKTNKLKAVTHVDGTARVQTITKEKNECMYMLLKKFKKKTGFSVLCNTSLNYKGKGFINKMSDLVKFVIEQNIDGFFVNDKFYIKKG